MLRTSGIPTHKPSSMPAESHLPSSMPCACGSACHHTSPFRLGGQHTTPANGKQRFTPLISLPAFRDACHHTVPTHTATLHYVRFIPSVHHCQPFSSPLRPVSFLTHYVPLSFRFIPGHHPPHKPLPYWRPVIRSINATLHSVRHFNPPALAPGGFTLPKAPPPSPHKWRRPTHQKAPCHKAPPHILTLSFGQFTFFPSPIAPFLPCPPITRPDSLFQSLSPFKTQSTVGMSASTSVRSHPNSAFRRFATPVFTYSSQRSAFAKTPASLLRFA